MCLDGMNHWKVLVLMMRYMSARQGPALTQDLLDAFWPLIRRRLFNPSLDSFTAVRISGPQMHPPTL